MAEELSMIMQAIKEVDANVNGMRVELNEVKQEITEMKQDITDIKRELKRTNRRIDEMGEDLSDQIKIVHDEYWETRKEVQKIKKKIGI